MLQTSKIARVLFDEAHGEAWTVRPEVAKRTCPSHPEDASYARAADALLRRDFEVAVNADQLLLPASLTDVDVLVIAHPSDPKWESTVSKRSPRLTEEEINAVVAFVRGGGGLIVLGETEQDKYGNNLNELLARFGLQIANATVFDYVANDGPPTWIRSEPVENAASRGLLTRVDDACFYRAGVLSLDSGADPILSTSANATPARSPLAAVADHGAGRVAVLADSDIFGDDQLDRHDHEALWLNLVYWAAAGAFRAEMAAPESAARDDASWQSLKAAVDELRMKQEPDGSIDLTRQDAAEVGGQVDGMIAALGGLLTHFPHQSDYIEALVRDLQGWVEAGFGRPDFSRSLELFRPELTRRDGIQHLVLFPMYTQNGSPDTRFDALIVRVPWPQWLADLERDRYQNAKFVPVTLIDYTQGYNSQCAVLFPETVAVQGRAVNNFGGIFCDREAERFRRVVGQASELLSLNLPPDAHCLLQSQQLAQSTYALWDLIHDRSHSRGDLPFDPFMIRQRMPYWMYSLEELRCDLTAFGEAVRLEQEGLVFGRYVQYAILCDRLFRFPVTGSRVRNYDGLGGQLLFAFLHQKHVVHWTNNRLTVDWKRVAEAVAELRDRIEELYRTGIDSPRVSYWLAAHQLISRYVQPNHASRWIDGAAALKGEQSPRAWIDAVCDDEFPLSIFYTSLKQKLKAVIEPPAVAA